jgi:hypothetical protein
MSYNVGYGKINLNFIYSRKLGKRPNCSLLLNYLYQFFTLILANIRDHSIQDVRSFAYEIIHLSVKIKDSYLGFAVLSSLL